MWYSTVPHKEGAFESCGVREPESDIQFTLLPQTIQSDSEVKTLRYVPCGLRYKTAATEGKLELQER